MLDKILINSKINLIEDYIKELEKIIELDDKEILNNFRNIRTLERDFQLIVDEIIDINIYLIKEKEINPPADFQSTFEVLSKEGIFPSDFAIKIAPVVGLRNKIIHRYEEIDRKFFIKQVKKDYKDFIKYIRLITKYINNQ